LQGLFLNKHALFTPSTTVGLSLALPRSMFAPSWIGDQPKTRR
jgi:hypothetical protein